MQKEDHSFERGKGKKKRAVRAGILLFLFFAVITIALGAGSPEGEDFGLISVISDAVQYRAEEEHPELESYYYYHLLEGNEKKAYLRIYEGLLQEKEEIYVYFLDDEELDRIVNMVLSDHPEIFYYDNYYEYLNYYNVYIEVMPRYAYTGEERKNREEKIKEKTEHILKEIGTKESEYETVKAVYEYLIETVDYVDGAPDNQNMYSALVGKETVCAGYAAATQYLLQKMGLEALYITGDAGGEPHAWNIVKIDGIYSYVDTTYGDRLGEEPERADAYPEEYLYDYNYLCFDEEQMEKDREIDVLGKLPDCEEDALNYYKLQNTYFTSYSDDIWTQIKEGLEEGEDYWECRFEKPEDYEQMLKDVKKKERYHNLVIDYLDETKGYYTMKSWYSYDEGTCTINCWYESK